MFRFVFVFFCCFAFLTNVRATVWISSPEDPVRIGILKTEHLEETVAAQAILLDRLRREFQPRDVNFTYYDWENLEKAVKGHSLDLVLCPSSFFSTIEHEKNVKPLVGLIREGAFDADHMSAAALVTLKSREPQTFSRLAGKSLFIAPDAHESNIAFESYLLRKGINKERYFSEVHRIPGGKEALFTVLEKNPGSAAVLPACALEELAEADPQRAQGFSVVDPKKGDGLNCKRTTDVFPGWVLASVHNKDMNMVHKVTAAALTTAMAGSMRWGFPPENFTGIRNVLIDLHYGPYAGIGTFRLMELFYAHRYWVYGIVGTLLLVLAHSVSVVIQVRRKTKSIEELMQEKMNFSKEMAKARERIESMEKLHTVNQLSAMLAHELKQPLGAIRNYSRGLIKRVNKQAMDPAVLLSALNVIVAQSDRAANIVDQVRSYAKNASRERSLLSLNELALSAVQMFQNTFDHPIRIRTEIARIPMNVEANALELELAVINLLKNAADAIAKIMNPEITVKTSIRDHYGVISITDNGKKFAENEVEQFFKPLFTTKEKGMGLGLGIVTWVAESHGGRIEAHCNETGGLTFDLLIPLSAEKNRRIRKTHDQTE